MSLKRKVMSVVLSVSLFSTAILISSANGLDEFERASSTNIVAREEGVLGVAEEFIKTNFSYLYSKDDYKLVDSNSKVFIRYLQFTNKYKKIDSDVKDIINNRYKNSFLDIHQNGGISHTTIVSTPGPNFRICSHTANHKDVPINTVHPYGKNGNYRSYVTLTALY